MECQVRLVMTSQRLQVFRGILRELRHLLPFKVIFKKKKGLYWIGNLKNLLILARNASTIVPRATNTHVLPCITCACMSKLSFNMKLERIKEKSRSDVMPWNPRCCVRFGPYIHVSCFNFKKINLVHLAASLWTASKFFNQFKFTVKFLFQM